MRSLNVVTQPSQEFLEGFVRWQDPNVYSRGLGKGQSFYQDTLPTGNSSFYQSRSLPFPVMDTDQRAITCG